MTEETTINATQEPFVFVALFKNVYESKGKKLISYKPGYVPKDSKEVKTFPVGLWSFDTEQDGDFKKEVYHKKFWLSVVVNEDDKWDLMISLNDVDDKSVYHKIYLNKTIKEDKVGYWVDKPVEIEWKNYWVNLTKNVKKEKPQDLNLTFKEAWGTTGWFGSEKDVDFWELDI